MTGDFGGGALYLAFGLLAGVLNARQTDSYIEQLLNSPPKAGHRISMVRDVRIFVNTIDHAIRLMTDNGVPATAHREEKDGYIEYTVRIPTAAAEK